MDLDENGCEMEIGTLVGTTSAQIEDDHDIWNLAVGLDVNEHGTKYSLSVSERPSQEEHWYSRFDNITLNIAFVADNGKGSTQRNGGAGLRVHGCH